MLKTGRNYVNSTLLRNKRIGCGTARGRASSAFQAQTMPKTACGRACSLVRSSQMWRLLKETLAFLRQEKKRWMVPLVLCLVILAIVIVFAGSSVLAPFIYPFL